MRAGTGRLTNSAGDDTVEHATSAVQAVDIGEVGGVEVEAPEAWRVFLEREGTVNFKILLHGPVFPFPILNGNLGGSHWLNQPVSGQAHLCN